VSPPLDHDGNALAQHLEEPTPGAWDSERVAALLREPPRLLAEHEAQLRGEPGLIVWDPAHGFSVAGSPRQHRMVAEAERVAEQVRRRA
jgi:hypothetical protein